MYIHDHMCIATVSPEMSMIHVLNNQQYPYQSISINDSTLLTPLVTPRFSWLNDDGPVQHIWPTTCISGCPHYEAAQDHGAANGGDAKTSAPGTIAVSCNWLVLGSPQGEFQQGFNSIYDLVNHQREPLKKGREGLEFAGRKRESGGKGSWS